MSKEERNENQENSLDSRIARVEQGLANLEVIARLSEDKIATVRHIRERLEAIRESIKDNGSAGKGGEDSAEGGLSSLETQITKELAAFNDPNPTA